MIEGLLAVRRYAVIATAAAMLCPTLVFAQPDKEKHSAAAPEGEGHHEDLSAVRPSVELMASSVFRTVSAVVPIKHRLAAEVHYFGLPEVHPSVNVVQTALSYQVPLGRFGFIAPGAGYYWGKDSNAPSASVRWMVEAGPIVSEGLLVQGLTTPEDAERAQIWDGNHVSLAMLNRKLEVGPTWEHIHIREEDEWKWGARVAARVHERVMVQAYVMTPGKTEWRGGFVIR